MIGYLSGGRDLRGMSDLCFYELDDNVWNEFGENDDNRVPHPSDGQRDQFAVQSDGRKKPRCEAVCVTSSANEESKNVTHGDGALMNLNNYRMLENGPLYHTQDAVLPASYERNELESITTDNKQISGHCLKGGDQDLVGNDFCAGNLISGERSVEADDNLNGYHISQIENGLLFLDNDREDKESSDLLYYGWPDIGNFEDVDRIFRGCDSTFGLGSQDNEDELPWFSSSNATEASEGDMKSGLKFSFPESSGLKSVSENNEIYRPNYASPFIGTASDTSVSVGARRSSLHSDANESDSLYDTPTVSESSSKHKSEPRSKELIKKHMKFQLEGKGKAWLLENGGSFNPNGNVEQCTDMKQQSGDSFDHLCPLSGIQQHNQYVGPDALWYTHRQTPVPNMNTSYGLPSDKISVYSTLSTTISEDSCDPSPTTKESFHESNLVQSIGSSNDLSFKVPAISANEKRDKSHCCQHLPTLFPKNLKNADVASPAAYGDPVSVPKQMRLSKYEIEGPSEVEEVKIRVPAEVDYLNAQDNSCVSSVLDETSLESSFHQIQQVIEKLDIRTRLCIRDSLHRLARSADLRHNFGNPIGDLGNDDRNLNGTSVGDEKNKCPGFLDIETDTNPIDRSIAHLLFHRPSDPYVKTTY